MRLAIKDFVDDVNVSAHPLPEHDTMPEEVTVHRGAAPHPVHPLRPLRRRLHLIVPLCEEQLGVSEDAFWSLVRAEIVRHHARFPELKERFELFDMLTPEIERLWLNCNRLHVDGYRDRSSRPHAAIHGTVPNRCTPPRGSGSDRRCQWRAVGWSGRPPKPLLPSAPARRRHRRRRYG
ncbi:hypothetical protein SCYAM73S_04206 [Streptomyces cyaneofuscatus]